MNSKPTILEEIFAKKKMRVEEAKKGFDYAEFVKKARSFRRGKKPNRLREAVSGNEGVNIIAEIKRASPSKGVIKENPDVAEIAENYEKLGAKAISVLTEEDFFQGSVDDLLTAKNQTGLPILRKDFVFDEFQIYESALLGADACLLIVAMLSDEDLRRLYSLAYDLGLDALVETHDLEELVRAIELGAEIIGVNNRNLHTFEVSLDVSKRLIEYKPANSLMICESGLSRKEELIEMKTLGFDGFLIGESLMKSENLSETMGKLNQKTLEIQ